MEILKSLDNSTVVSSYELLVFKNFEFGFYINISTTLVDNSELFIKEYTDQKERNYSYHWQKKNGDLICRWDNAPYHKKIKTFPHHKHQKNKISESYEININDILKVISRQLAKK